MPQPDAPSPESSPTQALVEDRRLADLLRHLGEGFAVVDAEERFTLVNPAAESIFGVEPEGLIGRNLFEFLEPDQQALVLAQTRQRQAGEVDTYELRIRRPNGEFRDLWVTVTPENQAWGSYHGAAGFFRDITPRKRAEEALQRSERRFRTLVEEAPVAVAMTREGRFLHVNRAWLTLFGFEDLEALDPATIFDIVAPESLEAFRVYPDQVAEGLASPLGYEFQGLRQDGEKRVIALDLQLLNLDDGPATLGFFKDITALRRAEAEREALIGELRRALDEVQILSGLLPVCSYCRKIRDDHGYWNRMEAYLEARTQATFSHGICPECLHRHFPEIEQD